MTEQLNVAQKAKLFGAISNIVTLIVNIIGTGNLAGLIGQLDELFAALSKFASFEHDWKTIDGLRERFNALAEVVDSVDDVTTTNIDNQLTGFLKMVAGNDQFLGFLVFVIDLVDKDEQSAPGFDFNRAVKLYAEQVS